MGRSPAAPTKAVLVGWMALAAGLALAILINATGRSPSPIYDGLPVPEPYRYVSPPPDLAPTNQPPLAGQGSIPVQNGRSVSQGVQTDDGQVSILLADGGLQVSSSARSVLVRIDPVTDPPASPAGFDIRGNVYRISAVEQPSGAPVLVTKPIQIIVEAPPGPLTHLQWYDGTSWHALETNYASDRFPTARLSMFGEIAAMAPASSGTGGGSAASGLPWPAMAVGLALALGVLLAAGAAVLLGKRLRPKKIADAPAHQTPQRKAGGAAPHKPTRRKRPRR